VVGKKKYNEMRQNLDTAHEEIKMLRRHSRDLNASNVKYQNLVDKMTTNDDERSI
jgi:hypothetical protein